MKKQLMGANIIVKDLLSDKKNNPKDFYVSFGKYNEKTGTDGFGVEDMLIFYYFDDLKQLKNTLNKKFSDGYKLLKYELVYR